MPTSITLINYTDQGIRQIKDSPKRLDAARTMLKDLGGTLKEFHLAFPEAEYRKVVQSLS